MKLIDDPTREDAWLAWLLLLRAGMQAEIRDERARREVWEFVFRPWAPALYDAAPWDLLWDMNLRELSDIDLEVWASSFAAGNVGEGGSL